jgi:hypothetical protein
MSPSMLIVLKLSVLRTPDQGCRGLQAEISSADPHWVSSNC